MNTALWIIQILLGIKFITVSYTHGLRQSQPAMRQAIQRMGKSSQPWLYVTAVCTLIGSISLILPPAIGVLTWITPVAAVSLSIMMLLSIVFHLKYRQKPNIIASIILCVLAAFVAYGRWILAPL